MVRSTDTEARLFQDMKLAAQAAQEVDSPMPLCEATKFLYEEAVKYDGGRFAGKDFSSIYQFLQEVNAEAEEVDTAVE